MTTAAVIGIGDISGNHLHAIVDHPAIDLVAVCDIVPERAEAAFFYFWVGVIFFVWCKD